MIFRHEYLGGIWVDLEQPNEEDIRQISEEFSIGEHIENSSEICRISSSFGCSKSTQIPPKYSCRNIMHLEYHTMLHRAVGRMLHYAKWNPRIINTLALEILLSTGFCSRLLPYLRLALDLR